MFWTRSYLEQEEKNPNQLQLKLPNIPVEAGSAYLLQYY